MSSEELNLDAPYPQSECKCCGATASLFGVVDLTKSCEERRRPPKTRRGIPIHYYRCVSCGLIFTTAFDQFSHEDFANHIYNAEYAEADPDYVVSRPTEFSRMVADLFTDSRNVSILDYGGGNGIFADRLRGSGFTDVTTYDPFVSAHAQWPERQFDLVTCFEVLEHSTDPNETLDQIVKLLKPESLLLFTTLLVPANIAALGIDWWYIAPRNGHVTLFSESALRQLLAARGLHFDLQNSPFHVAYRKAPEFASHVLKTCRAGSEPENANAEARISSARSSTGAGTVTSLHEQGVELARHRRFEEAAEKFRQAADTDPEQVQVLRHLAQAYSEGGRWSEAESAWQRYLERSPNSVEGHRNLGNLRKRMEKFELAVESLKNAVDLAENSVAIRVDYGIALTAAKQQSKAKETFERALELEPDHYEAHLNLGMLLQEMNEGAAALVQLRRAIELRPEDPSGLNNLGVALSEQGNFDEALTCFNELLARTPDYVLAWNNLGNSLRAAGRYEEAAIALQKALEFKPDYTEAYNNLGIVLAQAGEFAKAIASYDRALLLRPDYPEAHANRGLVYLLMGNFQQGWADYEWRWQGLHGMKRRKYSGKMWDGSPLAGKRLLLYFEQGLGDTFQFIRYARELKSRGATVIFECQANTRQILDRTPGIDEFVIRGEKPAKHDFYAPLLGLPGLSQTNLDNLPRRVPYIFTDPALIWEWKRRIASIKGMRIGIVWQGNPEHKGDRLRSIPLTEFAPLANVPGVTLISLQKNLGVEQIEKLNGLFSIEEFKEVGEDADGWLRTAAIICNLDLVICADTAVAHLAGAMGIPVWVAIPSSPDWRWLIERDDTPWYPTMRLFRQDQSRQWSVVLNRMAEALRERIDVSDRGRDPANEADQSHAQRLLRQAAEHLSKDNLTAAQSLLREAIQLDPTNAGAHQDLGVSLAKQRRLTDAVNCFRRALELSPDSASLYSNLGLATLQMGRIEESISHLRKAIWLGAGSFDTHKNLARASMSLPDPIGAEESYLAALRLRPDDAEAHYQLSRALLMASKFEQGWLEHEWRFKWRNQPKRHLPQPRWSGQDLAGKRIVVLAEGDPRDTIQFARYFDVLAEQGAKVATECEPVLTKLLSGCRGVSKVIECGSSLPDHDFYIPLMSLPATLSTTLHTVPAARPYLGVPKEQVELLQLELSVMAGVKVAIALEHDSTPDGPSTLSRQMMAHFKEVENVTFLQLQQAKTGSADNQSPPEFTSLRRIESLPADPADAIITTAAAIRSVELLITVDNTIAHIAGAMGIATWIILPLVPEPRWLLGRDDTPWYPTMRLFRQQHRNGWNEIAIAIVRELNRRSSPTQH